MRMMGIGAAALVGLLTVSCVAYADDDHDRSKGEARAEKQCEREAEQRGMRVERVGSAEKVGKKEYEVKLRVDGRDVRYDKRDKKKGDDDFRVMCHYDDKSRRATLF